jgi:Spy/CpxP family protein refolding chaperone
MKRLFTRHTAAIVIPFLLLLLAASASQAFAQTPDEATQTDAVQGNQDANWATILNLTPDQVARIRAIRQQNRLDWQAAKQRVNQAQRALDQAIYSDDVSDDVIEQLARDVAEAQAAEVRLRARTELSIRRVLTPQQLNTFRTIRQERIRAAQMKRRMENANRPLGNRRLQNGINPSPTDDRVEGRPAGGRAPLLGPRPRRNGLPRRIRP